MERDEKMAALAYKRHIDEVTEKAWQTFHFPPELCQEYMLQEFYQTACIDAEKEFWTGEWCDLPRDEEGQIYWLQQYWAFMTDRIVGIVGEIEREL